MYNSNRRNNSSGRRSGGFSNHSSRGFTRQFRGGARKLDPNMFINKASEVVEQPLRVSNVNFSDYEISDRLKRNIVDHGFTTPTQIQEGTIPPILEGRDIIGIANTGTGKTAAFLIPLINKVDLDRNQRVLIITPTRELAVQIGDELRIFSRGMNFESVQAIGGANIRRQTYGLSHNPQFVIGTPGRLIDLIKRRQLNLALFQNIVLDEVDRMVDIGFIRDIKYMIALLPKVRQSLFFSATVDGKTQEIIRNFVTNAVTVSVKQQETAENIDQDIIRVNGANSKIDVLHDLLAKKEFSKVLIFGRTKWGMEKLAHALIDRGFRAAAIHGNKSQSQRQRALQDFKSDQLQVLIATDVASRGLDIEDVSHVINYDAPTSYEDYVHRIGRTGRAGKKGVAITFVE